MIFFNSQPSEPVTVEGNDPQTLGRLLQSIRTKAPGGGTDMYRATAAALKLFEPLEAEMSDYHPSVIVMSDGRSKGQLQDVRQASLADDVPVYTILFGNADQDQMAELARMTSGRMFDGRKDMIRAFRKAKGYN